MKVYLWFFQVHSHKACWFGEILSHCVHFCGSELCRIMCSLSVYRLLSQASQIWHCTRSRRTEFSVCRLRIWARTSFRVVNVLAQYSHISVFASLSASWIRNTWDCFNSSVKNLDKTYTSKNEYKINSKSILWKFTLTFCCSGYRQTFSLIFFHAISYEYPADNSISTLFHIQYSWIFWYRKLCAATCAH